MIEAGLPQFELVLYSGILAPRGLASPIVERLNTQIGRVVRMPELEKVYRNVGAAAVTDSPAEFGAHMRAEMGKLGKLVTLSGARIE